MAVLISQGSREVIRELGPGVVLVPTSAIDLAGVIEATCGVHRVRVFQQDLMERSQRIEVEAQRVSNGEPNQSHN